MPVEMLLGRGVAEPSWELILAPWLASPEAALRRVQKLNARSAGKPLYVSSQFETTEPPQASVWLLGQGMSQGSGGRRIMAEFTTSPQ